MLRALIEKAENEGLPIYFETQTEGNVRFYKKFGFEVLNEIILPECNLPMWYLFRKR